MSDFQIFQKMSKENMDIKASPHLVAVNSVKRGGHVTMGVDQETANQIMNQAFGGEQTHYVVLLVINKEQFDLIKKQK